MKNVALLSMNSLEQFECYDELLVAPMLKYGWRADTISWRKDGVDWKAYDAVIVRSTWDYQNDINKFISRLEEINLQTHLENNLELMKWNIDKIYLKELEEKGIKIVPSIFGETVDEKLFEESFNKFGTNEIIIKPTISANADNTLRIRKDNLDTHISILTSVFSDRPYLIQPFMKSIITEGEYSLFYFGGKYSHAILKKPKQNDFRVQEEHGGILTLIEPTASMKREAEKILEKIETKLLYARIDFVRKEEDKFALMELELIEPSLYFNMDQNSAERFAKIFDEWMNSYS